MIFHRTPINYLLVNLAIADAMYATFVTPQTFLKMSPTHPGGDNRYIFVQISDRWKPRMDCWKLLGDHFGCNCR